jgi:hypothetical protein
MDHATYPANDRNEIPDSCSGARLETIAKTYRKRIVGEISAHL